MLLMGYWFIIIPPADPLKRTIVTEPRGRGHHVLGRVWLLVAKGRSGVLMSYVAKRRLFDNVVVQAGRRGQVVGRGQRATRDGRCGHVLQLLALFARIDEHRVGATLGHAASSASTTNSTTTKQPTGQALPRANRLTGPYPYA